MEKHVKNSLLGVDHVDDGVAEDEHYAVMKGTRWVYPLRDRDLHSCVDGAFRDGDTHVARQPSRGPVGQRLKAFLRKLVGRRDG